VTDEKTKEPEITSPRRVEKKKLLIAGITTGLIILVFIVMLVIIQSPSGKETDHSSFVQNSTPPEGGLSPKQTQEARKTIVGTAGASFTQTPTPHKISALPVNFVLQPGDLTNCGLTCRQLDASITNTGDETAHNVCITVGLHNSRNEIINLNGETSINHCIGDLAGGQTRTEAISINADCGTFGTRCIGETLTLQTQVTSGEKTVRFPDQVISV
jgi:hypothetical protein